MKSLNNNQEFEDKLKSKRDTKSSYDEGVAISRPKRSTRLNSETQKEPEKSGNKRSIKLNTEAQTEFEKNEIKRSIRLKSEAQLEPDKNENKRSMRLNSESQKESEKAENRKSSRSTNKESETVLANIRPKRSARLTSKAENN